MKMIMLVTYRSELRDQLNTLLQAKGHETCIPPHRQDVVAVMEDCHPDLIVLDLYLADPSGLAVLKILRDDRYQGPIVMLSGPSMTSVLHDALPMGVDKVVHVPEQITGRFDFGELELAIETSLKCNPQKERKPYRGQIARRAHELYEEGGCQDGRDMHDWLRAEQELPHESEHRNRP
jgi:DNA-binding response OmpR family regulator